MHMRSFNLSAQGASHIKKNKECQDASCSYYDDDIAIAIVCDGHGGDDYVRSAVGSAFACRIAEYNIKNFINGIDKAELKRHPDKLIANLEASIISGWNELIYAHYERHPFQEHEIAVLSSKAKKKYLQEQRIESAYGTTLIAVAVTRDFWFGIHIGDGKCVAVNPEGKFLQPIPWDDKCFLNATTSMCDSSALSNFRHIFSEKLPVAVFVGSDGIDDCFSNAQQLNNLYKTVLYSFATSDFDSAVNDLKDYLPRLSAKGSGDDVSIAAILDLDRIGEINAVKEFDREKERARVAENARREAEKAAAEKKRIEAERGGKAPQKDQDVTSSVQDSPKYCASCGAELIPGMKFCGECGTKVATQETEPHANCNEKPETMTIVNVVPFSTGSTTDTESTSEESSNEILPDSASNDGLSSAQTDESAEHVTADNEGEMTISVEEQSSSESEFEHTQLMSDDSEAQEDKAEAENMLPANQNVGSETD